MKKQIVLFIVAVAFILAITGASSAVTQVDTGSAQYAVGHNVTEQALADTKLKLSQSDKNLVITTASTAKLNGKTTEDSVQAVVDSTKNLNGKQQITHGSGNLLTINDPNGALWFAFVSDSTNGLMVKKYSVSKSGTITSSSTVNIGTTQSAADFKKAIAALGSNGFAIANIANLWKAGAPADLMALTFTNGNINQGTISNYASTKSFALKYPTGNNYIITTAGGLDDDTAFYGAFGMNDIVFSTRGPAGYTVFINFNGASPNRSGTLAMVKVNDLTSQFGTVTAGTLSEVKFNLWLLNKLKNNQQDELFSVLAFKTVNEENIQYLWYDPSLGYGHGIDENYINGLTNIAGGWTGVSTVIPITDYDGMVALGQDAFNYAFNNQHLFTIEDLANGRVALSVPPYYVNYQGTRSLVGFIDGVVRAANAALVNAGLPNAHGFTIDNILSIRNSWFWGMDNIQTFFMFVDQASVQDYAQHRGENLAMNYLTIKSVRSSYAYDGDSYVRTSTTITDISPALIKNGKFLGQFIIPAPAGLTYAWSAGASYEYLRTIARVGCICSTREYDLSTILQGQFPLGPNEFYILTVLTNSGETNRQISGRTTAWGVSPGQGTYYSVGQSADSAYQLIVTIWNSVTQTGRSMLITYDNTPIATAMEDDGYTIYSQENDLFWHLDHGWVDEQDVIASSISAVVIHSEMNQDYLNVLNSAGLNPISYMLNYVSPTVTIDELPGLNEDMIINLNTIPGATIYYTLDGTTPTTQSPVYTGPIPISKTTTLQYMAVQGDYFSPVYKETYVINIPDPIPTPDPTPDPTPTPGPDPTPIPSPIPDPGTVISDAIAGITGALVNIANVITEPPSTADAAPNEIAPGIPNPTDSDSNSPIGIIIGAIILAVVGLLVYLGRDTIAAFFGRE